jgi:SdpI/YhfL family protein
MGLIFQSEPLYAACVRLVLVEHLVSAEQMNGAESASTANSLRGFGPTIEGGVRRRPISPAHDSHGFTGFRSAYMPPTLLFPALGLLLAALGWPMATRLVRPNRWYGLRVPATFADERVWYEANAVAGRDMIILGAVLGVVGLVLPHVGNVSPSTYSGICAGLLGVGSVLLSVRGWRLANRLLRQRRPGPGAA